MVLFPIALLWLIAVIIWVVRNEGSPFKPDESRLWRRWLPRPPRGPRRGRPGDRPDRAGLARRAAAEQEASAKRPAERR